MDARPSLSRVATILNQRGLHARAAAKFVKLASQYEADIEVRRGDLTANGRSIMGLMMLSAGVGNDVEVTRGRRRRPRPRWPPIARSDRTQIR